MRTVYKCSSVVRIVLVIDDVGSAVTPQAGLSLGLFFGGTIGLATHWASLSRNRLAVVDRSP